jgi:hypothetical protein
MNTNLVIDCYEEEIKFKKKKQRPSRDNIVINLNPDLMITRSTILKILAAELPGPDTITAIQLDSEYIEARTW